MLSRASPRGAGKRFGAKDAGCHIDHSAGVLSRLFDLVGSDTCDVVFCCTSVESTDESDPLSEHRGGSGSSAEVSSESRQRERQAGGATAAGAAAAVARGAGAGAVPAKWDGKESAYGVDELPAVDRTTTLSTPCSSSGNRPRWDTSSSPTNHRSNASKEFRCHRVLFASCSEYFRALLYGGMSESKARRVELRDVAPEGFEAIVTYVYTGRVRLAAGKGEKERKRARERQQLLLLTYVITAHTPLPLSLQLLWVQSKSTRRIHASKQCWDDALSLPLLMPRCSLQTT